MKNVLNDSTIAKIDQQSRKPFIFMFSEPISYLWN